MMLPPIIKEQGGGAPYDRSVSETDQLVCDESTTEGLCTSLSSSRTVSYSGLADLYRITISFQRKKG